MDRRDIFKLGIAAGAGLVTTGGSSCLLLPKIMYDNEPLPLPDMDRYLSQIDKGVDYIENRSIFHDYPELEEKHPEEDQLSRKAIKTLYLTAMFSDLPEKGQVHPGMQERIQEAMPDMDRAVYGISDHLESRTTDELKTLKVALRRRSNPGMEIAEKINHHAKVCGVSKRRRLQTRAMFTHVVGRMKCQPPGLLFHEYVNKVEKMKDRHGSMEEMQRWVASQVGEKEFWKRQERLNEYALEWKTVGARGEKDKKKSSGSTCLTVGGVTMGLGVILLIVGGIVVEAGDIAGAFVMTAGGVLLLGGLIALIIGAASG
jgi:hypothetical protein